MCLNFVKINGVKISVFPDVTPKVRTQNAKPTVSPKLSRGTEEWAMRNILAREPEPWVKLIHWNLPRRSENSGKRFSVLFTEGQSERKKTLQRSGLLTRGH